LTRQVSARFFKQTRDLRQSALEHSNRVKVPVLVIFAGKDELMKNEEIQKDLNGKIDPAILKFVVLPGDYHLAMIENPKTVAAQITSFVDSTL
jgi:pimeloyl-ACP methyl ester carboxylesterase